MSRRIRLVTGVQSAGSQLIVTGLFRPGANTYKLGRLIHADHGHTTKVYVASEQVLSLLLHYSLSRFKRLTQ